MKRFLKNIEDALADSALLEMGVDISRIEQLKAVRETLEENLIEVAFAEAGEYDQIHEAILREHWRENDMVRPDDCHYGDNDVCFA
jgi:DNA-binding FadR family transcriptional regulator